MIGVVLLGILPLWAADSGEGYALLIQQSPPDGGFVNPGSGIHRAPIGETVTLSAVPKEGYRFMYWLGDVANAAALDTTISVDSPKMVVAVFSRENHEEPLAPVGIIEGVAGAGGGGRYFNPITGAGSVSPTGGVPEYPKYPPYNPPKEPKEDDFPVPEPTTLLLFGLGMAVSLRKQK